MIAMSVALHATYFDASALVKWLVDEPGSDIVREYWNTQATRTTTQFCFYETLSILKGKMGRGELTKDQYFKAAERLAGWYGPSLRSTEDPDFTRLDVFMKAEQVAKDCELDLSDAFQLLSLEVGYYSSLAGDSKTLLVTADEALAAAARARNVRVWDCLRECRPAN